MLEEQEDFVFCLNCVPFSDVRMCEMHINNDSKTILEKAWILVIFIGQNRGAQNKATPIMYNAYLDSKGQE